ncbi:MAG TPA: DUF4962 domain-containing protein, partial [bacterium]|nr:DUF4962 domain-containing protein [bacterium]
TKIILDSVPQEHPRLFIRKNEVKSYRRRAKNGDLKEICKEIIIECEKYIGEELVTEPGELMLTGPRKKKYYDDIIYATRPQMDIMEKFALLYILTGDIKYGNEAKRRILYFFGWDPNGFTSYESCDEPAMWVMMRGIRAYDWTYNLFGSAERSKVEEVMKIRAEQFYNHLRYKAGYHSSPYRSHANRALGFLGEACLCFAHEWEEADEWFEYTMTMFWNVYPVWGRGDGGWHEGPGYWSHYMSFVLRFIVALKNATGVDLMKKEYFLNTPYYKLYTNPPYAKMSPFGDEEQIPPTKSMGKLMYQFSTLLNDPHIRWYADFMEALPEKEIKEKYIETDYPGLDSVQFITDVDRGWSFMDVVLKNDALKSKSPLELPQAKYFPGVGLVSLHTELGNADNDIHFLIHSDPYGNLSHAHPDANAFTIEAFGEALAIASGYYPWYNSPHHAGWSWETKSSNSITIDGGIGQIKRSAASKGKIVKFESNDIYDYVLADATQAYRGILDKFQRHVVHIRPGIFIIFDDVEAPKPVTFEWWIHALSEMSIDELNKSITISQGNIKLETFFLQKEELSFKQFKGFPVPPELGEEDQWHVTASAVSKKKAAHFITLLVPYKEEQKPEFSIKQVTEKSNEISIIIIINNKQYIVSFLPGVSVNMKDY